MNAARTAEGEIAWEIASGGAWAFSGGGMSAPMLTGLDWGAMSARLEGFDVETRGRVLLLLEGIEAGALRGHAETMRAAIG